MTVYLVGAGPGDPDLITVRALELIKRADVIMFDRLVNRSLLEHAKGRCLKIFVGKEPDHPSLGQEEINKLLVSYARKHNCVVRLKGGDPFVFGRGGEEMEALVKGKVPFEVVPGITSAIAGPAYAGIPVTHRGNNSSFTLITGHRWDSSRIMETYSSLSGTLVILMGASSFPDIGKDLMEMGYDPQTTVCAIRNATTSAQSVKRGTLLEMSKERILPPSVIIVGGAELKGARWFENKLKAFRGKKVLVMRTPEQFEMTKELLGSFGAQALNGGHYELSPVDWDRKILECATIVVFTSANTVPLLKEDILKNIDKTYVAIGPGTRRALEEIGISAEMPDHYSSEGLGMLLRRMVTKDDRIMGMRSAKASNVLASILADLNYIEVPVYDMGYKAIDVENIASADVILFTSTEMVRAISGHVGEHQIIVSIGPQTTAALKKNGLEPHAEATHSTIDSMIGAVMDVLYEKK
jgi:uroporphyrinogen III methyltransferase/synthase